MYSCDYTIEIPTVIDGIVVSYHEVECRLVVDEQADLIKVGLRPWTLTAKQWPVSIWCHKDSEGVRGMVWRAAHEALNRFSARDEVAELAHIPWAGRTSDHDYRDDPDYTDRRFRFGAR